MLSEYDPPIERISCVQSHGDTFSSTGFAAISCVEKLGQKHRRRTVFEMEDVLRRVRASDSRLRNDTRTALFLFLVPQWRKPAWIDAASGIVESLGPNSLLDLCCEHWSVRWGQGEMEINVSRLGSIAGSGCTRDFHAGNGVNRRPRCTLNLVERRRSIRYVNE